jgi:signal transduction histidine kinase
LALSFRQLKGILGSLHVKYSNANIIQTKDGAIKLGITIAVICISCIAVVGTFFGYLLTRRLDKVANTARQIGQGKLDAKTHLVGKDEVALVAQTIDYMGDSISKMIEELNQQKYELHQARDSLEQRVQERTQELAIARDEALMASSAKSAFLANMSHELRTPLNAILGYSEMLMEHLDGEDESYDAKSINIAGRNLLALINNVLDIERIEAGKLDFQISSFNIDDMLKNLESTFKPMAAKNHNRFETKVNTDTTDMVADEAIIHQILLNLLSNAAKFTKNGLIAVNVSSFNNNGEEWLDFTVSDTGIGIDENHIAKLFEKFYQVDSSFTREYQGVGLGLSICNSLAHAMGGRFKVSSELNKGTRFSLLIARDIRQKIKLVA